MNQLCLVRKNHDAFTNSRARCFTASTRFGSPTLFSQSSHRLKMGFIFLVGRERDVIRSNSPRVRPSSPAFTSCVDQARMHTRTHSHTTKLPLHAIHQQAPKAFLSAQICKIVALMGQTAYLVNVERPEVDPLWVVAQHALQHTSSALCTPPWALELMHGRLYNDLECKRQAKIHGNAFLCTS